MRANHLSLCAGIGGIDLGLRRVVRGLRTVAMVEREGFCVSHLASKMEAGELDPCPIYPDLLRFPWDKYRGLVDIVSGGFPCQPFSHAGSRKATEDSRHLWPHIKAGVSVLRPSFCFFENVDGIASAKSPGYHSVLHHVLSDLEEMGFNATAGQFSAEEVGAPHLRKRWFILAHSRCNDAPSRGKCEAASEGSGERHGQSGSGCDAGPGHSEASREIRGLAYSDSERLEGRKQPLTECSNQWPVGPSCPQRSDEPPRTTQPGLGGHVDGVPNRVDRLRALGNAVVPQAAATAFSTLYHQLVAYPD
jgi:DNA (cytosine-5)-methyltransferase 1